MDSDPPPSYNSVVKDDRLQKREDIVPSLDNSVDGQKDQKLAGTSSSVAKETNSTPYNVRDDSSTRSSQQEGHQLDQQRPLGLWERFKKGLEDIALFVIQVLD